MWDVIRLPLVEIIVVGAVCGLVGGFAVLRGRVFFAESITHATFPGAVLGVVVAGALTSDQRVLSLWLLVGAMAMCLPLAVLMRALTRIPELSGQAAAGIVLTLGFALGYFLDRWFSPLPLHVDGFLTGALLHVNGVDLAAAVVVLAAVLLVTCGQGHRIILRCFDADGARAAGVRGGAVDLLVLAMILVTVVVIIPAVGTVLSIALVAAPAASLRRLVDSPTTLLVASPVAGACIGVAGLLVAVGADLSACGTIAVLAGVFHVTCRALGAVGPRSWRGGSLSAPARSQYPSRASGSPSAGGPR
ncbi:metal ABC transporter permease [Acidipropionibacterium timonense]|uniref:metal ABC transporter permease n=1 Tax=Acidipropionibacterium timonense TaxID=2161818 RepID=UPI00102F5B5B|nr:metal ABC transporter permease [Acidipropionibacterium timonense]